MASENSNRFADAKLKEPIAALREFCISKSILKKNAVAFCNFVSFCISMMLPYDIFGGC